jgi:hypothetical protein
VTLGAPGLAILLVLLVVTSNGSKQRQWVAPGERLRYGLSDDTWTRGLAELTRLRVITCSIRGVSETRTRSTWSAWTRRPAPSPRLGPASLS